MGQGLILPGVMVQEFSSPIVNPETIGLSFWSKATLLGNDFAMVSVNVYDTLLTGFADDNCLFAGQVMITNSESPLTQYSSLGTPFDFNIDSGTANLLSISCSSSATIISEAADGSTSTSGTITAGTTLWIDDFILSNSNSNSAGVNEIKNSIISSVYPNPVSDILYFKFDEQVSTIDIISLEGKNILSKQVNNSHESVDVSGLKTGIYLYRITLSNGLTETKRFEKN